MNNLNDKLEDKYVEYMSKTPVKPIAEKDKLRRLSKVVHFDSDANQMISNRNTDRNKTPKDILGSMTDSQK